MAYPTDREKHNTNRAIMAQDIDRDSVGRQLTPQARERAIEFALETWKGDTYAGTAVQAGIRHATSDVLKR